MFSNSILRNLFPFGVVFEDRGFRKCWRDIQGKWLKAMAAKRGITTLTLHGQFHKITQFSEDTGTLHPFSPQVITKAYCLLHIFCSSLAPNQYWRRIIIHQHYLKVQMKWSNSPRFWGYIWKPEYQQWGITRWVQIAHLKTPLLHTQQTMAK